MDQSPEAPHAGLSWDFMAQVFPFQPLRYSSKAGDASDLVTQPYDKIPDELRERYLAASPYNFVRLIKRKGEGDEVYKQAADLLDDWIASGILEQDPEPGFYPYFQEFTHPETGDACVRKGFIAICKTHEYEERIIHAHELTHRGPKEDRLKLTTATRAYFGQLFFLYDDPEQRVDALLDVAASAEPIAQAHEEGVTHKLWRISAAPTVAKIQELMADKKLLVADGHHRYETALAYKRAHPEVAGADKVMMTLVNMSSQGLVVLATHRILEGLDNLPVSTVLERAAERFEVEKLDSPEELQQRLDSAPAGRSAIGAVFAGDPAGYLFKGKKDALDDALSDLPPEQRNLDVVALHRALIGDALGISEEDVRELKGISYVRGFESAVDEVRSGGKQVAFLLRPVSVHEVAEISFSGGVMPQKSTDFYPKLLSGFATYRFG